MKTVPMCVRSITENLRRFSGEVVIGTSDIFEEPRTSRTFQFEVAEDTCQLVLKDDDNVFLEIDGRIALNNFPIERDDQRLRHFTPTQREIALLVMSGASQGVHHWWHLMGDNIRDESHDGKCRRCSHGSRVLMGITKDDLKTTPMVIGQSN